MHDNIPVFDLSGHTDVSDEQVLAIGHAYQAFGFAGFTGHGIDDDLIARAHRVFAQLFELPEAVKQKYRRPGQGGARGYTGFGIEQAKDHDVPDLKEFWHIGREVEQGNRYPDVLFPNFWPVELPALRSEGYALFDALDELGRRILKLLARFLTLREDWFEDKVDQGNGVLRAIHYPPITAAQAGQVRAAAHEDINVITLLVGSEQAGLEILTRNNRWIPVTTIPGTIVVNIGDMLQRLTNHVLPSTTHRVVNPEGDLIRSSRYSMPYFLHFNPDVEINTLPQCIAEENPDRYPETITANEYLQQRLEEIKLA